MRVTIQNAGDLKAVAKALKVAEDGRELRKELSKNIRAVTTPMVRNVQAAWLAAPAGGSGRRRQPSLRSLLAKATRAEVRFTGRQAGVRVRTDGRKMPDGMKALPGYAEGVRRRPWRHPVFGDTDTWVQQDPFPRFYRAVQPDVEAAERATEEAIGAVLDKIARSR